MGLADISAMREQSVESLLDESDENSVDQLDNILASLENEGLTELTKQGLELGDSHSVKKVHVKYQGTDTALIVDFGSTKAIKNQFESEHQKQFGFIAPEKELIIEAVSVEVIVSNDDALNEPDLPLSDQATPTEMESTEVFMAGSLRTTPIYDRDALKPGNKLNGPAIITEPISTIVVEPGWQATVTSKNHLILETCRKKYQFKVQLVQLQIQ